MTHRAQPSPIVAFPDDRECSSTRPCPLFVSLASRRDVTTLLLRPRGFRHSAAHSDSTRDLLVFDIDTDLDPAAEGRRFLRWCEKKRLAVEHFCCATEPLLEYWHAFARSAGLPALSANAAQLVRDKSAMKARLRAIGLEVAEFSTNTAPLDAARFADTVGYPLIGKPRRGWGTIRTDLLMDPTELAHWSMRKHEMPMMVEAYQGGEEIEVCALVQGGKVLRHFVSIMPERPLAVASGALNANISLAGRPDLEPVLGLGEISQQVVTGFSLTDGYLHMEMFLDTTGDVVFGEVAFRYPGCQIAHNHGLALGFDIDKALLDIHLGRPVDLAGLHDDRCVGDLLLPIAPGTIRQISTPDELRHIAEGVIDVHVGLAVGDIVERFEPGSFHCSGWVHVEGSTPGEVRTRMEQIQARYVFDVDS